MNWVKALLNFDVYACFCLLEGQLCSESDKLIVVFHIVIWIYIFHLRA